jgi:hypothetical protein
LLHTCTTKCMATMCSAAAARHRSVCVRVQCSGRTPSQVAYRNALKRGGKSYLPTCMTTGWVGPMHAGVHSHSHLGKTKHMQSHSLTHLPRVKAVEDDATVGKRIEVRRDDLWRGACWRRGSEVPHPTPPQVVSEDVHYMWPRRRRRRRRLRRRRRRRRRQTSGCCGAKSEEREPCNGRHIRVLQ